MSCRYCLSECSQLQKHRSVQFINGVHWFIYFSAAVDFVLTSVFPFFSVPVTESITSRLFYWPNVKMWKMSSLSSIMIILTHRRTTSIVSAARPAAQTKVRPTPSSLRGTFARPVSWSGCWKRPGRPSTPSCCSWLTLDVEEAAGLASVAPVLTIPTWCTRTSVTEGCVRWVGEAATRTAAVAATTAATAEIPEEGVGGTGIALLPLTGIAAAEMEAAATAPALIHTTSTRITTATAAAVSTTAPGPPLGQGPAEWHKLHLLLLGHSL